jgi:hypothetical protein
MRFGRGEVLDKRRGINYKTHLNLCQGVPERSDVHMASPAGVLSVPFVWRVHAVKELILLSAIIIVTATNL